MSRRRFSLHRATSSDAAAAVAHLLDDNKVAAPALGAITLDKIANIVGSVHSSGSSSGNQRNHEERIQDRSSSRHSTQNTANYLRMPFEAMEWGIPLVAASLALTYKVCHFEG